MFKRFNKCAGLCRLCIMKRYFYHTWLTPLLDRTWNDLPTLTSLDDGAGGYLSTLIPLDDGEWNDLPTLSPLDDGESNDLPTLSPLDDGALMAHEVCGSSLLIPQLPVRFNATSGLCLISSEMARRPSRPQPKCGKWSTVIWEACSRAWQSSTTWDVPKFRSRTSLFRLGLAACSRLSHSASTRIWNLETIKY